VHYHVGQLLKIAAVLPKGEKTVSLDFRGQHYESVVERGEKVSETRAFFIVKLTSMRESDLA